ncbi:hypothetical protein D9758_014209 [Tetrapyrgos nigripes]|uniref:Uncharacterized protein n=1 Tax=Tetrapyrgos nigripes TaxID=182062 RepID=A0A8H5CVV0_9AGAR|nr:hypothetical protein D9758_014209 [Tetrapyrgos nigripes]
MDAGGYVSMISISPNSRQPVREPWSLEKLIHERAICLSFSIDTSSSSSYSSALNSYLTFCKIHDFPITPTPENLSMYAVFMSAHINPRSVNNYLSGIASELKVHYPEIRQVQNSSLVTRTMTGCLRRWGTPINRKLPLSHDQLDIIIHSLSSSQSHDDFLFKAMVLTGFHGLLRLGEITDPSKKRLINRRKTMLRHSVNITDPNQYSFFLPGHKADRFFEGNLVVIQTTNRPSNPTPHFLSYLNSRDEQFPLRPELWIRSNSKVPTREDASS